MYDNLRDLLPDDFSDETAHHLVNFFYQLALAFESIHLGKIMRYQKSLSGTTRIELNDDMVSQDYLSGQHAEEIQDPPF